MHTDTHGAFNLEELSLCVCVLCFLSVSLTRRRLLSDFSGKGWMEKVGHGCQGNFSS